MLWKHQDWRRGYECFFCRMVVEVNIEVEEPRNDNVHNNAYYTQETLLKSESQTMRNCNQLAAHHWIVQKTRNVNRTGQLTGYKLVPGLNRLPLAVRKVE